MTEEEERKEWCVVRTKDHAYLNDPDGNGTESAWENDPLNATWMTGRGLAMGLAEINGLTDEDGETLLDGYALESRDWVWEEDIEPDELDRELDGEMPW